LVCASISAISSELTGVYDAAEAIPPPLSDTSPGRGGATARVCDGATYASAQRCSRPQWQAQSCGPGHGTTTEERPSQRACAGPLRKARRVSTARLMGKLKGATMATGPFGNRRTIPWKPRARLEMSSGTAGGPPARYQPQRPPRGPKSHRKRGAGPRTVLAVHTDGFLGSDGERVNATRDLDARVPRLQHPTRLSAPQPLSLVRPLCAQRLLDGLAGLDAKRLRQLFVPLLKLLDQLW
jgi:hypothetical protein